MGGFGEAGRRADGVRICCGPMDIWSDIAIFLVLAALIALSTWFGLRLGRRVQRDRAPDKDHLGTIQGALLGLLGLLLGFSFSGAMSRFIDRQDALSREANAIQTAYQRADLLPTADRIKEALREYAALRLELFRELDAKRADQITNRMNVRFEAARLATMDGLRQTPALAAVALGGIEPVGDEFARRSAIAHRRLPVEMVLVLVLCSCISLGTISYGVGLAERRSIGSVVSLAALVTLTLFVTFDFDRPRRGFIRLDPAPLESAVHAIGAGATAK